MWLPLSSGRRGAPEFVLRCPTPLSRRPDDRCNRPQSQRPAIRSPSDCCDNKVEQRKARIEQHPDFLPLLIFCHLLFFSVLGLPVFAVRGRRVRPRRGIARSSRASKADCARVSIGRAEKPMRRTGSTASIGIGLEPSPLWCKLAHKAMFAILWQFSRPRQGRGLRCNSSRSATRRLAHYTSIGSRK